jgi:trimeric autotransporter adhesin
MPNQERCRATWCCREEASFCLGRFPEKYRLCLDHFVNLRSRGSLMFQIRTLRYEWRATMACWFGFLGLLSVAPPLSAQCDSPGWQPGEGLRGMNGTVTASLVWERPGGAPPVLVAAGSFSIAGTTFVSQIALWNGSSWEVPGSSVPAQFNDTIHALTTLPDGSLVAGGTFRTINGVTRERIARWDGTAWQPLGTGLGTLNTTIVRALAVLPNGDLIAAGRFMNAGGVAATNIARWNGTAWQPLGSGLGNTTTDVNALLVLPGGDLISAGTFTTSAGVSLPGIARWTGEAWLPLGAGISGNVRALTLLPNGDLVATGDISAVANATQRNVLRWDGNAWLGMSAAVPSGPVGNALQVLPNSTLVAAGSTIQFWNGLAWVALGGGSYATVNTLTLMPNGDLVAGGSFQGVGGVVGGLGGPGIHASGIARWDGARWHAFGTGFGGASRTLINALLRLPDGDVIAGGAFLAAGGVEVGNLARWNGKAWSALGPASLLNGEVRALARLPNGDLVAGGSFSQAGSRTARGVARWDGLEWWPVGTDVGGTTPSVTGLALLPNGDLVAVGSFFSIGGVSAAGVARWNGTVWSPFGSGVLGSAECGAVLSNGDLVVGGTITSIAGVPVNNLGRWNGTNWSGFGMGLNGAVRALQPLPEGRLLVGGNFGTAGGLAASRVALWNGGSWTNLGAGIPNLSTPQVNALAVLANGDFVVGGKFTRAGTTNTANLARWDGTNWNTFGAGTSVGFDSYVYALAALPEVGFLVGGGFSAVDGMIRANFAHWGCRLRPSAPVVFDLAKGEQGFSLQFEAPAGRSYSIRYTKNLQSWLTLASGLQGFVLFEDNDPVRQALPQGFYQVVED